MAILSLALGIGANTAIFELIDAVLMRTLPVPAPQQLADIQEIHGGREGDTVARQKEFSFAIWDQLRQQQKSFSGIAAWSTERLDLGQGGEAHYAEGMWVSGSFFQVLQVQPVLGRLIAESDDYPGVRRPRSCHQQRVLATAVWWPFRRHWQQAFAGRTSLRDSRCLQDTRRVITVLRLVATSMSPCPSAANRCFTGKAHGLPVRLRGGWLQSDG